MGAISSRSLQDIYLLHEDAAPRSNRESGANIHRYSERKNIAGSLSVNKPDNRHQITKLLFLLGLNASDEQSLFKAFRNELNYTVYPYHFPYNIL